MKSVYFKIDGRKRKKLENDKQDKNMTWKEYIEFLYQKENARHDRKKQALKFLEQRYNKGFIDFSSYVGLKNRINRL